MNVSKRFLTLLLSVIVLALLASVSLAGPGSFGRAGGEREDIVATDDGEGCDETTDEGDETTDEGDETTDEGDETTDEGDETTDEGDETTDEGDECDADGSDDSEGETEDEGEDSEETDDSDPADVERETACLDAAGIEPSEESEGSDDEATKAHGLDNAIDHVLANCLKNPQAPGLLNALERLAANRERHEAHEEWKAEKEAAKDARKAEKEAAKDARKDDKHAGSPGHGNGHGGAGGNGNPHDGGSHGNGHH